MRYERIRDLREDADLTQTQIANIIYMQQQSYSAYELGKREVSFNIAILLAKYYNVSLDYIA